MAGIAGALYVPQVGIINPSEFSPANSIEAVIWVAVGGRGTLTGAVVGAILVNYAKTTFTAGTVVPYWFFGTAIFLTLIAVVAVKKRTALIGAIVGLAITAVATPFVPAFIPNWPFSLAAAVLLAAMASSWQGAPLGAAFGVLLFGFFMKPHETVALAPYWLFALGGLFVAVTLLLPLGIVGTLRNLAAERRLRRSASDTASAEPAPRPAE
jgi:ABC-type branched-subunit amino acid transport system permease subunit